MAKASEACPVPAPIYRAGQYVCPKCKNRIVVLVDMSAPPMCWNHINKSFVEMERKAK